METRAVKTNKLTENTKLMTDRITSRTAASTTVRPKASAANGTTVALLQLPGLDLDVGMAATLNNSDLYLRLLRRFRDEHADFPARFRTAFGDDIQTAARTAHSLKGVAGNLGISGVQAAAAALETACKQQAGDIDQRFYAVCHELEVVINGLKTLPD